MNSLMKVKTKVTLEIEVTFDSGTNLCVPVGIAALNSSGDKCSLFDACLDTHVTEIINACEAIRKIYEFDQLN